MGQGKGAVHKQRMVMLRGLTVFLFLLLGLASSALAHPAPYSFIDIHLIPREVRGAVVIHDFDAAFELGLERPESLRDPAVVRQARDPIVALLDARLRMAADGEPLTPQWGEIQVLAERQSLRLPFTIPQAVPARLDLEARLFPYDPSHQTFVNIYEEGQLKQQAILEANRPTTRFYSGTPQGRRAVVQTFLQAGVHHIVIGPDHVLFLCGLLLLGGSWRRLVAIVTAFTIGHSITLSLAALEVVRVSPRIVEPLIALSIIVVGVDAWLVSRQPQAVLRRDLRPWLASGFGLIHGLGFAAVLIELGLPREALAWSLAAFNIGVEIGQLVIVLVLIALAHLAMRRLDREGVRQRLVPLASIAVIAAGLYWFTQRIIFAPGA